MKTFVLSASLILLSLSFVSCEKEDLRVIPSNQITSDYYSVADFDELSVEDPFQVYIQFSDTENDMRIEANENLHRFIQVKENDGRLVIKLDEGQHTISGSPVLKVFLTAKSLKSVEGQGVARFYLETPWNEPKPEISLSGASELEGTIYSKELTADLTGASSLAIDGEADNFDIKATGASTMSGFDFACDYLTADLEGASEISLTVNNELEVTASGASKIYYRGTGLISYQNLSGGSEIIKD